MAIVGPGTVAAVETVRTVGGVVCGALVAAAGAVILGEYEFSGALPFVAGLLFGYVVAEVVASVGKVRTWLAAVVTAALSFGGIVWAGWIDSSEGLEPMKALVWVSAALAAAVALVRVAPIGRARPGAPAAVAPEEAGVRADER